MARRYNTIEERLERVHVDPLVGIMVAGVGWVPCKLWTGALTNRGYANLSIDGVTHSGHRVVYALEHGGQIDRDLVIDHLCSRRRCIEGLHLEQVTQEENVRRGASPVGARMRAAARRLDK